MLEALHSYRMGSAQRARKETERAELCSPVAGAPGCAPAAQDLAALGHSAREIAGEG